MSDTEISESENSQQKSEDDHGLYDLTMKGDWPKVVEIYRYHPDSHTAKLTKSEDTALHIAISMYNDRSENPSQEDLVKQMIGFVSSSNVLHTTNVRGDTPLHLAAAVGWVNICTAICIAPKDRKLVGLFNEVGETPLFLAAYHGHLRTFLCLDKIYYNGRNRNKKKEIWRRATDGNTILHSAISAEYFDLAYQIIELYEEKLVNSVNINGESPLHVLAQKSNVFLSTKDMGFYDSIIYQFVFVGKLKKKTVTIDIRAASQKSRPMNNKIKFPENYRTCLNIFLSFFRMGTLLLTGFPFFKRSGKPTDEENQQRREEDEVDKEAERKSIDERKYKYENTAGRHPDSAPESDDQNKKSETEFEDDGFFPANYTTCVLLFKFAMRVILIFLGIGFWRIKKIRGRKQMYTHASMIMNKLIKLEQKYKYEYTGERPDGQEMEYFEGSPPKPEPESNDQSEKSGSRKICRKFDGDEKTEDVALAPTPILVATKLGILEMVKRIIHKCPVAIQDLDYKGNNILMLAAEHRQRPIFDYLLKSKGIQKRMLHHLDDEGNNILHHAAVLGKQLHPWRIPGAALQMQWEIKWFKYVRESVPPQCVSQQNTKGETPHMIFTRTHEEQMKAGRDWLIKTSESCSVVAALIATVAFATSSTVPGGLEQSTGYPVLRDDPFFGMFAIASLMSLCLSVMALVFFLAIITSRYEQRDFKISLPRKLLVGLTSLFASIASILLSFCAGHKFILNDRLRFGAVPIYAVASVPVVLFAFAQLPLYLDLLQATWMKVPMRNYKVF